MKAPGLKTPDFNRVMSDGRKRGNAHMLMAFTPSPQGKSGQRLGLIVTNKHGTAAEVNRLKRVLREAFRQEKGNMPDNCDVVLLAREGLKALDNDGGMKAVAASMQELMLKHPAKGSKKRK